MSNWSARERYSFTALLNNGEETTHEVHVGGDGPPVLILQELPGIGPETLDLAQRLNDSGFSVYLPHLFGTFGKTESVRNFARLFCVRREINMFLKGKQSPVAEWLRALTADINRREGDRGVGVIGMCLTGSFALPLMAEDAVVGGVASQPALPLFFGRSTPPMSPQDITAARAAMQDKGPGLAMRFDKDWMSSRAHMAALQQAFGDDLDTEIFPGSKHSLLTLDFHQPAYDRVEAYFQARFDQAALAG